MKTRRPKFWLILLPVCSAPGAAAAYPTGQPGYAVPQSGAQRTGYDQAYQAANTQANYSSKLCVCCEKTIVYIFVVILCSPKAS